MEREKREKFEEELIKEVREDFYRRQEKRRALEAQWELNMNFVAGNQYCDVNPLGEVESEEGRYFWQSKEVYNNITPIIESRLAKLSRVRPTVSVRASSDENGDMKAARLTSDILNSTCDRIELDKLMNSAAAWGEICGSVFYKVLWDSKAGKKLGEADGESVYEGDVKVIVCPPFEIFPENLEAESVSDQRSIIHARAVSVAEIEEKYGVVVQPDEISVYKNTTGAASYGFSKLSEEDKVLLIERYEAPCKAYPEGRLVTVAGDKLLYIGILPFVNGKEESRVIPFVKQISIAKPGSFFGTSVVERLIPVQKAYNAVKNRKHEFINRIANGILTVEDGSVDADALEEDGLSPGRVLVYRQGSEPPKFLQTMDIPEEFGNEEDRLNNEFIRLSGTSEISRNSSVPASVTSGVALQLLIEQDEVRLNVTAESIKNALREICRQIIRLFKAYATDERVMRSGGEGKVVELYYFKGSDLSGDDVVFDTESEITQTPAQKKAIIMELLSSGLLHDENGRISDRTRSKILEIMGYGGLNATNDLTALQMNRASEENLKMMNADVEVKGYDDHETHIAEHIRFVLSAEFYERAASTEGAESRIERHIQEHKKRMKEE